MGPWKIPTLAERPLKSNCPVTGLRSSCVGASPSKPSPQGSLQQMFVMAACWNMLRAALPSLQGTRIERAQIQATMYKRVER